MGFYKIQNITNLLGKRHAKLNTTQIIDVADSYKNQKFNLAPADEFVIESNFLPISLHKLRTEGLISVIEIDKNTYINVINEISKKKSNPVAISTEPEEISLQTSDNKDVEEVVERKIKPTKKEK